MMFGSLLLLSVTLFAHGVHIVGNIQNNPLSDTQNAPNSTSNSSGPVSVLTVGNGRASMAVGNALKALGHKHGSNSALNLHEAISYQLVLMDSGTQFSISDLSTILKHQTAIAILGGNQLNGLASVLSNNALTFPFASNSKQTSTVTPPSDMTAYAVLFHLQNGPGNRYPTSNFVFQGSFDPSKIANTLDDWLVSVRNTPQSPPSDSSPTGTPSHDPEPSFSPSAPTFIGNTRWITTTVGDSCGPVAAMQQVRMDYWYTTSVTNGQTYYWILQYTQHIVEGFSNGNTCYVWVPTTGSDYVDAETYNWPGQQLANWEPQGSGSGNPVSYTIGVGPEGPSASVTYSQSGVSESWSVGGNPAQGQLTWSLGFGANFNPSQSNTLLFSQPSQILELNPTLAGGSLPFIDSNSFGATFCAEAVGGWCSGVPYISTPTISFGETIYTNSISYAGNTEIVIDAWPTTDTYPRSIGLSTDQSLPVPWWPPYQSGYEICSSCSSTFIYRTYPTFATGSHYVQLGVSGFTPNYAWHAKIFVNGALAAEGDVGRNQLLTANFNV